jgi:AcrR family transcriptional regulator
MRAIAQRQDIRDLILDGVDVLLARYGYRKMTMEDLAQVVGIGKGTIYLHFPSKEEVTLSHIDRIVEGLVFELKRIAAGPDSAPEKIKRMLVARVLFRFDSVRHYSQSLDDLLSSLRGALMSRRQNHFLWEAKIFNDVLREGKRNAELSFRNVHVTSQALIGATNSFLPYSLTPRELGKRKEVEESVSQIVDLLLHGLIQK